MENYQNNSVAVVKMDSNGKLVSAIRRHDFSGILPVKQLLMVWYAAAFTYPFVCNGSKR